MHCDSSEAAALAFRLQTTFSLPFVAVGHLRAAVGQHRGRRLAAPTIRDPHQLLSDADAAMFAAKSSGRDRVHLFSPELREAARWRLEVATRLRGDAIDQLVVHYQPVVRLDTGEVEGVEALVRWQHPERGLLPPDSFLSVAEETGQVIPITRWLLRETTRKAAEWAAQGLPLRMSVNVSARHFSAETLVRDVRVALRDSGLPPDQLVLELTETSVAEDPTRAEDQLTVLRSFGVRVAIDDFGTGWSSLAQLFALPIGTLKIDRSLLNAAEQAVGGETGAVLAAIVGLTRTLGIRSVAEGVETPEHLRMVRAAGCDLAQGWLLGQRDAGRRGPGLRARRPGRRRRPLRAGARRAARCPRPGDRAPPRPPGDRPGRPAAPGDRTAHRSRSAPRDRPARQTAPVSDSLDAALATLTEPAPVATDGRPQPALDLLIWDAPNIDMTLSTVIGARPTAASRPRFDAIAAWFVEGAGDPTLPDASDVEACVFANIPPAPGTLQRWVEALRGLRVRRLRPAQDRSRTTTSTRTCSTTSRCGRTATGCAGWSSSPATGGTSPSRWSSSSATARTSSSSPSARSPATRSARTCSSSSTSRTSRARSPSRWTASASTRCRRTARGCGRPAACATSSAASPPAGTAEPGSPPTRTGRVGKRLLRCGGVPADG